MDFNEVDHKIKNVMSRIFEVPSEDITETSSPRSIPSWKGPKHLDMISAIEKEFAIKFDPGEEETFVNYKVVRATVLAYLD